MLALVAGILAIGMVGASIAGGHMLGASAQQDPDDPMPVDIGCPTGAEFCEDPTHSEVSTSGTATTRVEPDRFSVTVGVETNGTNAQEAAEKNAALTADVIAALRALGISEEDISTSNYSVYPVYETRPGADQCIMIYPPPPECQPSNVITGYRASNSLTVTLDADGDVEAGQVIDTAIEAGANMVQGAYFFLSQERQLEVQDGLIRQAIENARQRANIAASAVGMEVSGVKSISLHDVYFPIFSRGAGLEAADTQILPGQQEVTLTVNVVYVMSNGTSGSAETNNSQ